MRFCAWLIEEIGVLPRTAAQYFGHVQGYHAKQFGVKLCAGLKLNRRPAMLKGLRRLKGGEDRAVRRGCAPHLLREAMHFLQKL